MADEKKLHVVMFPWLAFGHMIPYLEVSKLLAQKGHLVSFVSTPRNIDRLPKLPSDLLPLINLVKLPLPFTDGLPENAEATTDVPYHKIQFLKKAADGLQDGLTQFLKTCNPNWVICDFAYYWLPPIVSELGISCAYYSIISAWSTCLLGPSSAVLISGDDPRTTPEQFTAPPIWVPFPTNVAFRLHEAKKIVDNIDVNASDVSDMFRLGSTISGSDAIVIRSSMGVEKEWLDLLGELHQKPVVPVGLLPPSEQLGRDAGGDETWLTIGSWLDKRDKGSVVYVALGSEVTVSQKELTELALGLEEAGLPFFWALRKKQGPAESDSVELPAGFEERVKDRGVVWTSWAPQLRILDHDSVGSFLTHCGWGSVIEGLHFGRALVMLPFLLDQGLNARVIEEKKVGVEIPRDEQNGSFRRNSVGETLRLVMVDEKGKVYKENAKEIRKIFGDKDAHYQCINNFVEYLQKRA